MHTLLAPENPWIRQTEAERRQERREFAFEMDEARFADQFDAALRSGSDMKIATPWSSTPMAPVSDFLCESEHQATRALLLRVAQLSIEGKVEDVAAAVKKWREACCGDYAHAMAECEDDKREDDNDAYGRDYEDQPVWEG